MINEQKEIETDVIDVSLGKRSYLIHVGQNILTNVGGLLKPALKHQRLAVVTDENVAMLHHDSLAESLDTSNIKHDLIMLPAGESTKDFKNLELLLEKLLELRIERGDAILALGGGVTGDLAGFAASILRRGVDFIQAPTTLLAQVDSSVGGKTAINTRFGKNLVGTFHQPKMVLADIQTLATLPDRDKRAGYAEVVKYGLIDQPEFFTWLEANGASVVSGNLKAMRYAVVASCKNKARIVSEDERETGRRALLNLGHTFAHALETVDTHKGQLLHGEAVAIGIIMAFDLSVRLGLCPTEDAARVYRHFDNIGLPTSINDVFGFDQVHPEILIKHMRQDKKVRNGQLTFILTRGIGQAFIASDVEEVAIKAMLSDDLAH